MPAAKKQPPQSSFNLIAPLSVPAGVAAAWFGYPALAAVWLVLLVGALVEPSPVLTGPKDRSGFPTPAGPREQRAVSTNRLTSDLRWRLIVPNPDWFPGWPVRLGFVMALIAAVAATTVSVGEDGYAWVNALAGFLVAAQVPASLRRTRTPDEPNPGVRFDSLGKVPHLLPVVAGGALVLVAVTLLGAGVLGAKSGTGFVQGLPLPGFVYAVSLGLLAGVGVAYPQWRSTALAPWRARVQARSDWAVVWETVLGTKYPPPTLLSRTVVGPEGSQVMVDRVDAPKVLGAAGLRALGQKIALAAPAGQAVAILNTPNVDSQGQELPGVPHPTRLDLVTWPSESPIDITDPSVDAESAGLMISAALSRAVDAYTREAGGDQYMLLTCEPAHPVPQVDAAPTGWARLWSRTRVGGGGGDAPEHAAAPEDAGGDLDTAPTDEEPGREQPDEAGQLRVPVVWVCRVQSRNSLNYIRQEYGPMATDTLGQGLSMTANPHPAGDAQYPGGGLVYAGALGDLMELEPASLPGQLPQVATMLDNLDKESGWNARWAGVLKQGANLPEPQFGTASDAAVNGQTIHALAFTIKQGEQVEDFFNKHEAKLATTLAASPFVSITGYPADSGAPGDRHPQAFTVRWSDGPVPGSAANLSPAEGPAPYGALSPQGWVLAGHVNAAFDKARLPRAEVFSAKPLTTRRSRGHVWQVEMRLHGGVTLADVRKKVGTIMSALGVPWVQVTPGARPQTMTMVLGADYRGATLANPGRDLPMLVDLEFQQAWVDANVVSAQGLVPTLAQSGTLPRNTQVRVLDFDLPSGITPDRVKGVLPKLRGSTKNEFLLVQPGVRGPSSVRLLASETDPMPFPAEPDWAFVDETAEKPVIPFATGVDGEPVVVDLRDDFHIALMGGSGSGKSACAQIVTAGVLAKGWDMVIVDVKKGAADFKFAFPWLRATGTEYREAVAVMEAAYAEVQRRVKLNSQHGVGSSFDLPEEIRPNRLIVFLDEFNNLIQMERPAKPVTDSPDEAARYAAQMTEMNYKTRIGALAGYISREARSAGVVLVLAGQAFKQDTLKAVPGGGDLKSQLSRVALGKMSYGEYQWAVRDPEKAAGLLGDSVPQGRGIYESQGAPTGIVQSWWTPDTQAVYAEQVRLRRPPLTAEQMWDLEPYLPVEAQDDVEGAVLDEQPVDVGLGGPDVIELDDMEVGVDALDLDGLDLDDMVLPDDDDEAVDGAGDGVFGVAGPVADDAGPEAGFTVMLTDDPEALRSAAEDRLVWFGEADPPVPADRVQVGDALGLFGHPLLDLAAAWLEDNPGARSLRVVSSLVGEVDDVGTPVAEALPEAAGGVPVVCELGAVVSASASDPRSGDDWAGDRDQLLDESPADAVDPVSIGDDSNGDDWGDWDEDRDPSPAAAPVPAGAGDSEEPLDLTDTVPEIVPVRKVPEARLEDFDF